MTTTAETLSAQAARLPPAERIELVEHILDSLDQTDGAMDTLWAKEASHRLTAYRRGEFKAVSLSDAIEKHQVNNIRAASAPTTPASDLAQAALAALSRAGLRAAEDALRANTHMVVAVDGKVLYESPQDYLRKRDKPATQPNAKSRD